MREKDCGITKQEEGKRASQDVGKGRRGVRAKDYRTVGQATILEKTQSVVFFGVGSYKMQGYLPTIPGELPKIADVFRTTAGEKGLTLGQTR